MTFDTRRINLDKLNSMTKYPSIELFHKMNDKYRLTDELAFNIFPKTPVYGSEKIDGTNTRIMLMPDGYYLLGSREELLYAKGDLIGNPAQQIINSVNPIAASLPYYAYDYDRLTVIYGETYGGKGISQGSKQYSEGKSVGFRVFDIAVFLIDHDNNFEDLGDIDQIETRDIAAWRDHGNQPFLDIDYMRMWIKHKGNGMLTPVPHLFEINFEDIPTSVSGMYEFMQNAQPHSDAVLDQNVSGTPEGIVFRSYDRKFIAKARREDYEKTLKIRK